ncbi:hypothetical protein [Flavobacterium sp. MK4S-17]|uniref:hypothetical protein n=1 Tax=Flavobacterium sp. MK4S-17 TaxID=2543737 RepID=UPI001357F75C|nr:hypothetical protein [Flavobacterium sp. MK4S-17]
MRNLEIKLLLPYNWYHARRIKIYDSNKKLLAKIAHCEHLSVQLDDECDSVIIRIDFIKSVIQVPKGENDLFLAVFMDFRDKFPHKYFDILKRNCVTGRFMGAEQFDNFNISFYTNNIEYLPVSKVDNPSVFLGLLISASLVITSIIQQSNPHQHLIFFIGAVSIISLSMLQAERNKIRLYDYKSRIIATALLFVLAFLFLSPSFAINMFFFIIITLYILRVIANLKTLKTA